MGLLRRRKLDIQVPTGRDAVNFRKLLFLPIPDTQDLLSNAEWERSFYAAKKKKQSTNASSTCLAACGRLDPAMQGISRNGDVYVWGKRRGPTGLPLDASLNALVRRTYRGNGDDIDSSDDEADEVTGGGPRNLPEQGTGSPEPTPGESNPAPGSSSDDEEDGGDEDFVHPVKLFSLCGEGVNHIAVGRVHCCAKTKDGDVFTWGHNDHCQLGDEPAHRLLVSQAKKARVRYGLDRQEPCLWERTVPESCIIKNATVGTNHTMVVTDKGEVHAFGHTHVTDGLSAFSRSIAKLQVVQVFTWGSNVNGCLGRPEELNGLEENFCAVPGKVEGMEDFVGRPCSIACGREFTLIATKPYIGPTREELERRGKEQAEKADRIKRQSKNVKEEKAQQLEQIRREKVAVIVKFLNSSYPKCSICKIGTVCPGFQRDPINPSMCKHCMHERRKHDDQHNERDRRCTLQYLYEVISKLGVTIDYSKIPGIELEEELEEELESYV
ncbi:hypothetical protein ATCC90586_006484 [Pythium insidiosum]|nr:hypothetical protein ATCC90586_006484 [Pythium insidiosum]